MPQRCSCSVCFLLISHSAPRIFANPPRPAAPPVFVAGRGQIDALRVVVALADVVATVPLGVLMVLWRRRSSLLRVVVAGFAIMAAVTLLAMLVISTAPSLMAVLYRTAGILIGAALVMRFEGQNPARWRNLLAQLVPWVILPYVIAVVFVSNLLTPHWRTIPEGLAASKPPGLLPFYHHYIVPKAHAAQSVAVPMLTFAPIG